MSERDTIYALSSGRPPAGVAVVRLSGPRALATLARLAGRMPEARYATLATLRDPANGEPIDRGLVLAFPSPGSFTGEDVAELQVHGGSAVIAALFDVLEREGLRLAAPGEFSRRAFDSGRLDLTQVEGLADLIAAESDVQRRQALGLVGGRLRDRVEGWRARLLRLAAHHAALLDFADEDDVVVDTNATTLEARELVAEMSAVLDDGRIGERLREGLTIAVVGAANAGKSSLINALSKREAAIVSPVAGTTRDAVEVSLTIGGVSVTLIDTAGLRESDDGIEQEGIRRTRRWVEQADFVLLLVDGSSPSEPVLAREADLRISSKADITTTPENVAFSVSAKTGKGLPTLEEHLADWISRIGRPESALVTSRRQRQLLQASVTALTDSILVRDIVLQAEYLRQSHESLSAITGRAGLENLLDEIFNSFCIGK